MSIYDELNEFDFTFSPSAIFVSYLFLKSCVEYYTNF